MSIPLVAKISGGIIGAGSVVGGGAFIAYRSFNRETVTKYLNSLHRELSDSHEDWELIKNNYAKDKSNSPIPNIPKSKIENKLKDLKKWCDNRISEKFSREKANEDGYKLVQAWCTKQVRISEHLKNLKLAALDTSGDSESWEKIKNSYSKSKLKVNDINSASRNISSLEGNVVNDLNNSDQKIKDWCTWASNQYFKYKEDDLFKRYEYFCTKPFS